MPQDTGVGRNVVLDGLDFASLRRVWEQTFGATWNGRTYQVEILDSGYRFDGKTYPSLTAITKRITGTHWSGPRFFGLTPKRKA